jgi:hypothetical protein
MPFGFPSMEVLLKNTCMKVAVLPSQLTLAARQYGKNYRTRVRNRLPEQLREIVLHSTRISRMR